MFDDGMPGRELWIELHRIADKEDIDGPRTAAMQRCAVILSLFFPEEQEQQVLVDLLLGYVLNMMLALGVRQVKTQSAEGALQALLQERFRLDGGAATRLARKTIAAAHQKLRKRPQGGHASRQIAQGDGCYLCGETFGDDGNTVDHVWPWRAAGTNSKKNLRKSHARCEACKTDLATPADTAALRFAEAEVRPLLLAPPQADWWPRRIADKRAFSLLLRDVRDASWRLAILSRQSFRCYICRGRFDGTTAIKLRCREEQLPWCYTNTIALCLGCNEESFYDEQDPERPTVSIGYALEVDQASEAEGKGKGIS